MQIPVDVYVQLETIRRSGAVNMYDRRGVQIIADRRVFPSLFCWLEDNREAYGRGLREGFEPERPLTDREQEALDDGIGYPPSLYAD